MKVAIITITGGDNYGNRLQNYAVQYFLKKYGCDSSSIIYFPSIDNESTINRIKIFINGCL